MSEVTDMLLTAAVHGVKNQLGELLWRLDARGDCLLEQRIALRCAQRLSSALLLWRSAQDQLALNLEAVDPHEMLDDLASEYQALFPDLQVVRVEPIPARSSPGWMFVDRTLLSMVLSDIVHNACRAARSRVSLRATDWQQGVCLEISDDGPGYPDAVLDTAGSALHAAAEGQTGLGLYLAGSVARAHRRQAQAGAIELCNAGGACFRMYLP